MTIGAPAGDRAPYLVRALAMTLGSMALVGCLARVPGSADIVVPSPSAIASASLAPSESVFPTSSQSSTATAQASPSVSIGPSASTAPRRTNPPPTPAPATPRPTAAAPDPSIVSATLEQVATVSGGSLAIVAPPDGSGRLFVAAKDGRVWILHGGTVQANPMLDLRGIVSTGGEQGLLGIAVHPRFPADPRVFVDYTDLSGNTVVASYALASGGTDLLDPASATPWLAVAQPYPNHNGGALAFGPDGMLYVSLGDGGSADDPQGNGQRLDTLLGKILRIDPTLGSGSATPYQIPSSNPFVGHAGARAEIWLYGLRNPWRMAFDRKTGDLWIGDVGQGAWEEVDVARAGVGGLNFGWDVMEGRHCHQPSSGCSTSGLRMPVSEYGHDLGCTVIGGSVYRGTAQPLLSGLYVFADYCSGRLWAIPAASNGPSTPVQIGTVAAGIAGFGEDQAGELYTANLDGTISRVVATRR